MGGATRIVLIVLLGLAVTMPAALAEEHTGEGYRLDPPHGFEPLSDEDAQVSFAHGLDLVGRLAPPSAMKRTIFVAGNLVDPDAVLLVARIEVDEDQFASSRVRHRYLLDRLHVDKERFEALVAEGDVVLRPTEVGGYEALEMTHPGVEGPLGLIEPAGSALLIDGGTHILVLSLMVRDTTVYPVEQTWSQVRGGLRVDPSTALAQTAILYGGIGLAGLLVLVLLVRLVGIRRGPPAKRYEQPGQLSMSSEGWGGKRPSAPAMQPVLDPEPASGMTSPLDQPVPETTLLEPEPAVDTPPAPMPDPTPLRAQTPASPTGPAAVVPAPAPAPATPAADAPAPAGDEGLPPAARPAARKRAGLKRTLPSSGRYSG